MDRLLIDECLSASLVAVAKERGLAAEFGPYVGMAGWQDWNIARYAVENSCVVVTNNRRDFLRLYAGFDLHPGLLLIVPNVERGGQIRLFTALLDHLSAPDVSLANSLLEVLSDGSVWSRPWSSSAQDRSHIDQPRWPEA